MKEQSERIRLKETRRRSMKRKHQRSREKRLSEAAKRYSKEPGEILAFKVGARWWKDNLWRDWEKEKPKEQEKMIMIKYGSGKFDWDIVGVKYMKDRLEKNPDLKFSWAYLDDIM